MNKKQYILGAITIGLIVGGTAYAIKKARDQKKLSEDPNNTVIDLEQAREIVKSVNTDNIKYNYITPNPVDYLMEEQDRVGYDFDEDFEQARDDARDEASWNASFGIHEGDLDKVPESVVDKNEARYVAAITSYEEGNIEEEKELKADPNSIEALHQYIKMELSEWAPSNEKYKIMERLYDYPVYLRGAGDTILKGVLIDYRTRFFTPHSKYTHELTIADVIMHYARLFTHNIGESVDHWVGIMISNIDVNLFVSDEYIDHVTQELTSHGYYNKHRDTYGLFGLYPNSYENVMRVAYRSVDAMPSFEMEFNEAMMNIIQ